MSTTPGMGRRRAAAQRARFARVARTRLSPQERRRHLLQAAADLLTRRGIDAVQFAEVAAAAGVTRQLVYRFFSDRHTLIKEVLEDFAEDLAQRFGRGAARNIPGTLEEVTRIFVDAVCDTIEAKGAGPWHLLDANSPDPELGRHGQATLDAIVAPWRARIVETTGASQRQAATVSRMIVAAGRAVLELWYNGALTREEAVRDATRGVSALLEAFTVRRRRKAPTRHRG